MYVSGSVLDMQFYGTIRTLLTLGTLVSGTIFNNLLCQG